ncbi:MAG: DUF2442 domain-containing protein [Oscillospiraceae bacterium]|jgi:hypothetical protein|nr:DUF2442 domain-containing protein [Oscillospiraceae bacterium]
MNIPVWIVKDVKAHADYTLLLTFANGEKRVYNARPLLDKPICQKLNNPAFFMLARAEYGTVVWDEDTDIAPEHLYEHSVPIR